MAKAILRGKFTAMQSYLRKQKSQINNLNLNLKQLEEEDQKNPLNLVEGKKSQRSEPKYMKQRGRRQ